MLFVPPQRRLRLFGAPLRLPASVRAWPLVLSLVVVVVGVMVWLRSQEHASLSAQRDETISDALSLEAQLHGHLEGELVQLDALAELNDERRPTPEVFSTNPVVLDGLRRFWVSLTWLSEAGRIQAHQPPEVNPVDGTRRQLSGDGGLTGHLSVSLKGQPSANGQADRRGGLLVARFPAAALLRQKVPWWLASKYDIRLVDVLDVVIAATVEGPRDPHQAWHRGGPGPSLLDAWSSGACAIRCCS